MENTFFIRDIFPGDINIKVYIKIKINCNHMPYFPRNQWKSVLGEGKKILN